MTRENLAEEITGDSTDEHDAARPSPITAGDTGVWRIAAEVPIDEAERQIGHQLPRGDYETVSGMLIAYLQDLPAADTTVRIPLQQTAEDLISDEPVTRYLEAKVVSLGRHVPELIELSVEITTAETVDAQEDP